MKIRPLNYLILIAMIAMWSCRKHEPRGPSPKYELVLEISAEDWLLRQAVKPIGQNVRDLAAELGQKSQTEGENPMDILERLIATHSYSDSLEHWFPDVVNASPESGSAIAQLRQGFSQAISQVEETMLRRLDNRPKIDIDPQQRLHLVTHVDDGGQRIQNLLASQGELGFYETQSYNEVIDGLQALRVATLEIEGTDTTFDLFQLNVNPTSPLGVYSMELEFTAKGPVIFFGSETDTARIMGIFRSGLVQKFFPPNSTFAWGEPPSQENLDVFPLIALKTTNEGKPALDGSCITNARQDYMVGTVEPMISLQMDAEGTAVWRRITRNNIGRCIAIVFDGVVKTYPTIETQIDGGRSQISGTFTVDEARDLANTLKGGAYPAKVTIVEMKEIPIGH